MDTASAAVVAWAPRLASTVEGPKGMIEPSAPQVLVDVSTGRWYEGVAALLDRHHDCHELELTQ